VCSVRLDPRPGWSSGAVGRAVRVPRPRQRPRRGSTSSRHPHAGSHASNPTTGPRQRPGGQRRRFVRAHGDRPQRREVGRANGTARRPRSSRISVTPSDPQSAGGRRLPDGALGANVLTSVSAAVAPVFGTARRVRVGRDAEGRHHAVFSVVAMTLAGLDVACLYSRRGARPTAREHLPADPVPRVPGHRPVPRSTLGERGDPGSSAIRSRPIPLDTTRHCHHVDVAHPPAERTSRRIARLKRRSTPRRLQVVGQEQLLDRDVPSIIVSCLAPPTPLPLPGPASRPATTLTAITLPVIPASRLVRLILATFLSFSTPCSLVLFPDRSCPLRVSPAIACVAGVFVVARPAVVPTVVAATQR